jgi:ATP-dependent Clp protease, protease subunit
MNIFILYLILAISAISISFAFSFLHPRITGGPRSHLPSSTLLKSPVYMSAVAQYSSNPHSSPEINPVRRDTDDPEPYIPVNLPTVVVGGTKMDVNSRLLKDRIIMIGKTVDDAMANVVVAQLLYLANEDPAADITLYINSPGGSISSGMAIFDTMQFIPCDVATVCFGMAASMGAFLLGAGTKGKRRSLPNARIMLHQPLGGARGQASDIEVQAKEILFVRSQINSYLSDFTGHSVEKIEQDCDRDFFLTAEEAANYGLIDSVVHTKTSHIKVPNMIAKV